MVEQDFVVIIRTGRATVSAWHCAGFSLLHFEENDPRLPVKRSYVDEAFHSSPFMKPRVFVSYTSQDRASAGEIEALCKRLGADVWRDVNEISAGEEIQAVLERAIATSIDILIVCLSAKAELAKWVRWERRKAIEYAASGGHQQILYFIIEDFEIPEEIRGRKYIEFYSPSRYTESAKQERRVRATEDLARFLVSYRPLRRLGLYDLFDSYTDLDTRREGRDGQQGCTMEEFLGLARERIVLLGLHFGNFLGGATFGKGLADVLQAGPPQLIVDFVAPDPERAPLENLKQIHSYGSAVAGQIRDFIQRFTEWGKHWNLTADQAGRCRLHLVKTVPTNSLLGVDPEKPNGRLIVDLFVVGVNPQHQPKLELRHPRSSLYRLYWQSAKDLLEKDTTEIVATTGG